MDIIINLEIKNNVILVCTLFLFVCGGGPVPQKEKLSRCVSANDFGFGRVDFVAFHDEFADGIGADDAGSWIENAVDGA